MAIFALFEETLQEISPVDFYILVIIIFSNGFIHCLPSNVCTQNDFACPTEPNRVASNETAREILNKTICRREYKYGYSYLLELSRNLYHEMFIKAKFSRILNFFS